MAQPGATPQGKEHAVSQLSRSICQFMPGPSGRVEFSKLTKPAKASSRFAPHILSVGLRLAHTTGRSGFPNNAQRMSGNNCTHGKFAGFPCGIPGIGDVIEGAMQHAPQLGRQSMA